ncbi:hypothetical protein JCM14720_19620 [Calditerricola yamamurae]
MGEQNEENSFLLEGGIETRFSRRMCVWYLYRLESTYKVTYKELRRTLTGQRLLEGVNVWSIPMRN